MITPLAFKKKPEKRLSLHPGTRMHGKDAVIHSTGRQILHRTSIKLPLA